MKRADMLETELQRLRATRPEGAPRPADWGLEVGAWCDDVNETMERLELRGAERDAWYIRLRAPRNTGVQT